VPKTTIDRDKRIENEHRAWELRQRGYSQMRIAQILHVDQGTVSRYLSHASKRCLSQLQDKVAHHKAELSLQLDHLIDESLQAWERSKAPKKKAAKREGGGKHGLGGGTVQEIQDRDGDPAFLDRAIAAMDRKRALWGLDEPPPVVDVQAQGKTFAEMVSDLEEANRKHDERGPAPGPDPPGVPQRPDPVQ
jgi:hypothetical protein